MTHKYKYIYTHVPTWKGRVNFIVKFGVVCDQYDVSPVGIATVDTY